jgi:glycosyltransferase involved in cell wall biosynthesis
VFFCYGVQTTCLYIVELIITLTDFGSGGSIDIMSDMSKTKAYQQIKIAIIGSRGYPYVYSGYETFVKELSERLVKLNVNVTVYNHRALFLNRPKKVNGINLVYMPAIEKKQLTQLTHSLLSFVHSCFMNVDIVFAVNVANGPFGLLPRFFGKKTIINVDGLEWLRPKWKGLGARYFYLAAKTATKLYNKLVNDSEAMRQVYLKEFNKESVVIAYGANIRYSCEPERIRKWGLLPGSYYLVVGRMIPDNNSDLVLRSFIKNESNKKLVIVGDVVHKDKYANDLKTEGAKDDRIIFTGYVNDQTDLAELYHNSYLYIHGHEYGGTNPALLKALAYGCAILALDTPFNREVLQGERYSILFRKEVQALKEKLQWCEEHSVIIDDMKSRSRAAIVGRYDWDKITEQYLDVFKKMIDPS